MTAYKSAPPRYCPARLTAGRGEPVNLAGGLRGTPARQRYSDVLGEQINISWERRVAAAAPSLSAARTARQSPRRPASPKGNRGGASTPPGRRSQPVVQQVQHLPGNDHVGQTLLSGQEPDPRSQFDAQTQNSAALWGSGLSSCSFCKCYSALIASSLVLISGFSCRTMFNKDLWTSIFPLYSMKPNLRNLFMKKLTRDRVVPIISASIS